MLAFAGVVVQCRWCGTPFAATDLPEHESYCAGKTAVHVSRMFFSLLLRFFLLFTHFFLLPLCGSSRVTCVANRCLSAVWIITWLWSTTLTRPSIQSWGSSRRPRPIAVNQS